MDIVVTGYAGYEGSRMIYMDSSKKELLLKKYPAVFFSVFEDKASLPGYAVRDIFNVTDGFGNVVCNEDSKNEYDRLFNRMSLDGFAESSAEGGVLAALWRLLKKNKSGGAYSIRAIPVIQQTIEVCEMFELNPYRLHSPECRVWLIRDLSELKARAAGAGVPLSVIGFTSKGAAIKRIDTYVESSLRRPEKEELYKVLR